MRMKSRSSTVENACARLVKAHGVGRLDEVIREGQFGDGENTKRARAYLRKCQLMAALPKAASAFAGLIGTWAALKSLK